MRYALGLAAACGLLAGCHNSDAEGPGAPPTHGRYIGVGTYPAGRVWDELSDAPKPQDKARSTTADDTQIIVVIDSVTGEVRECGDMSGYCIGQNPWRGSAGGMPAKLARHLKEIQEDKPPPAEAENVAETAPQSANRSGR